MEKAQTLRYGQSCRYLPLVSSCLYFFLGELGVFLPASNKITCYATPAGNESVPRSPSWLRAALANTPSITQNINTQ